MKRMTSIFCSVVLLCWLTACDPTYSNFFEYDELKNETDRVELIWYNNSEAKEYLNIKKDKLLPFDFEKMKILETLPEEDEEAFLYSLTDKTNVIFIQGGTCMDSPINLCIRLVYKSGDFEIFAADGEDSSPGYCYAGSFFENGEVNRFIGTTLGISFLIDEYFPNYEEE